MNHSAPRPRRPAPPAGWRRRAARLPVRLFRIGLGPLFGGRLLLLVHTGRLTGAARTAVLEVVEHTASPCSWTVASGYGPEAQWYRNLGHTPRATVQSGRGFHAVTARFLPAEDGGRIMARYAEARPRTAARLCAYLGLGADGTPEGYREAGRLIPFVRLECDPACHRPRGRGRASGG
ncbi:nitroreductase family deazaflavin-dependent oxidoreductase [Streptomyces spongiicola]|uniref:Nitroreductase family deazaflavin-dependent oxidoreductase n=1 Tax=Streptomyces spongiicola TaxID=1690221 RepID=A0A388SUB9_9ACTN|nr:nitroreductase family deazaflavin-dependent oxidoreductase [Streptomyces spongiicola]GBP99451.1 nitroreductase family deazaflavin-dependent oxidoreductase [Streptomyces spongiicola]